MLNVVIYIFLSLGILLALAIVAAIIYIIVKGPANFRKDKNKQQ